MWLDQISSQLALKLWYSEVFYEIMLDNLRDTEIDKEVKQECELVNEGRVEKHKEEKKCTPSDEEI